MSLLSLIVVVEEYLVIVDFTEFQKLNTMVYICLQMQAFLIYMAMVVLMARLDL